MHSLNSPQRKARHTLKNRGRRRSVRLLLFPTCVFSLYVLWTCLFRKKTNAMRPTSGILMRDLQASTNSSDQPQALYSLANEYKNADVVPKHSVTAILPVTRESLPSLGTTLSLFMGHSEYLHEVVIISTASIMPQTRDQVELLVSEATTHDHPDFSLRLWTGDLDNQQALSIIHTAAHIATEWVLLLDASGLLNVDANIRDTVLFAPKVISRPVGPIGYASTASGLPLHLNATCIVPKSHPQAASYLYPPFVMPVSFAHDVPRGKEADVWINLGRRVAESHLDMLGGVVIGVQESTVPQVLAGMTSNAKASAERIRDTTDENTFTIILPSLQDLSTFSTVACALQNRGDAVDAFVYGFSHLADGFHELSAADCKLTYFSSSDAQEIIQRVGCPAVVASLAVQDTLIATLDVVLKQSCSESSPVQIRVPHADLPYTAWMGSLSLQELKHWDIPKIDISVITQNRPRSLSRLLDSLSTGMLFGDVSSLQIHLEQSSDPETLRRVQHFDWVHGPLTVHHRVIQGGLLPAVTESWYPRSNDSYGLLLEDDIELSPWFYAWVKMAVLKYRYGEEMNTSPQLFGISLYQQKNLELKPTGRIPFNARELFAQYKEAQNIIPDSSTPYLSAIPCSWGAVYFPEHWREFHSYLSVRLSEFTMPISSPVVPSVRSNNWTKSWKRYFIELVYLRGYVMLYPNYANFVSLSTNHLEIGSHVKAGDRTREKREQFVVPLMQVGSTSGTGGAPLLELPAGKLPDWDNLPVLNLTGSLTTLGTLVELGVERRDVLTQCTYPSAERYDIKSLLCIDHS